MNYQNPPLITIVTVVYNDVENIEKTINSVINQSYKNIEYIIIDGGSTDGTVAIINKYRNLINHIVSERDKGIYDAMNKGTAMASGEWIIYMNSGDIFSAPTILEKIFIEKQSYLERNSVIYSDVLSKNKEILKRIQVRSLDLMWMGPPASHQCQFVKTELAKSKPFNLNFKINADYDFIYYIYSEGYKFKYFDEFCISIVDSDIGLSKTSSLNSILVKGFLISKQYSTPVQITQMFFINSMKYIYGLILRIK